jgi:hypothetical protein
VSGSIWATLDIAPTTDRAVIRRAYAARLKLTQPEDDPTGFQRLRQAYEAALRHADMQARFEAYRAAHPEVDFDNDDPDDEDEFEIESGHVLIRTDEAASFADSARSDWAPPETGADVGPTEPRTHDWRPPTQEETEPKRKPRGKAWTPAPDGANEPGSRRGREREWAPADPVQLADETRAAETEHGRLCDELQRRLASGAAPEALEEALQTLLASPALESVGIHTRTEVWLADLIVRTTPVSDPLVEPTIAHFHWNAGQLGPVRDSSAMVLARAEGLETLNLIRRKAHPKVNAYRSLKRKPKGWRLWLDRLTVGRAGEIRSLLTQLRIEHPSLIGDLDAEAVDWWDKFLSRPQIAAWALWPILFSPMLVAPAVASDLFGSASVLQLAGLYLAVVAAGAGIAFAWLFGFARVRHRWRTQWRYGYSLWLTYGWAPATLSLLLVASASPPATLVTFGLGILGLLMVYWALVTAEPDRRSDVGEPWALPVFYNPIWMLISLGIHLFLIPGQRFPWLVRSIFAFTYLWMFWSVAGQTLPAPAAGQLGLVLALAAFAHVAGAGTLIDTWRQTLSADDRRFALWCGAGALAVTLGGLALANVSTDLAPEAAALVAILMLAHKAPAADLGRRAALLRDLSMRFGWIGFLVLLAPSVSGGKLGALLVWGLWALSGVTVTVVASLWTVERTRRSSKFVGAA